MPDRLHRRFVTRLQHALLQLGASAVAVVNQDGIKDASSMPWSQDHLDAFQRDLAILLSFHVDPLTRAILASVSSSVSLMHTTKENDTMATLSFVSPQRLREELEALFLQSLSATDTARRLMHTVIAWQPSGVDADSVSRPLTIGNLVSAHDVLWPVYRDGGAVLVSSSIDGAPVVHSRCHGSLFATTLADVLAGPSGYVVHSRCHALQHIHEQSGIAAVILVGPYLLSDMDALRRALPLLERRLSAPVLLCVDDDGGCASETNVCALARSLDQLTGSVDTQAMDTQAMDTQAMDTQAMDTPDVDTQEMDSHALETVLRSRIERLVEQRLTTPGQRVTWTLEARCRLKAIAVAIIASVDRHDMPLSHAVRLVHNWTHAVHAHTDNAFPVSMVIADVVWQASVCTVMAVIQPNDQLVHQSAMPSMPHQQ
jgi:hypothetical protein